jgi:hypothetical protein
MIETSVVHFNSFHIDLKLNVLFFFNIRLATPIAMDQLAYTDDEAVKKVGIVLSIGCILTVISFAASGPLARRSD